MILNPAARDRILSGGLIYAIRLRSLHRAYPSPYLSRVVDLVPEQLNTVRHCGLWRSGIDSRLGRNRLWVLFLAVSDIYPMFIVQWAYDYLGPFGLLWVHMAWHKNSVLKKEHNSCNWGMQIDWWSQPRAVFSHTFSSIIRQICQRNSIAWLYHDGIAMR